MTTPDHATIAAQLEEARLDNRAYWRSSALIMLVLLVTGIGIVFIPIVAIGALLATQRNERDARNGVYGTQAPWINEQALKYWLAFVALCAGGVWIALVATWPGGVVIGVILGVVAVCLQPWQHSLRPKG